MQREFLRFGAEARGQPMGFGGYCFKGEVGPEMGVGSGVRPSLVPPSPAGGDSGAGRGGRLGGALNCLNGL